MEPNQGERVTIYQHYHPTVVMITVALHLVWAIGILLDPPSILATPLHAMFVLTGSVGLSAMVFFVVAGVAFIGLVAANARRRLRVLMILPQHMVLWVSVVGALYAMYLGQYADGVQRTHWFLVVDQVPIVLLALGHTLALLLIARQVDG